MGRSIATITCFLGICISISVGAEQAQFYCSLEDASAISDLGGIVTGNLTFVPGVNGNGVHFEGASDIIWYNDMFSSTSGSLSLWFKKDSNDVMGGLLEIGRLGVRDSIGIFFNFTSRVYFEMRNSEYVYFKAWADDALSETEWTHVLATWELRGNTYHEKMFVNGRFRMYNSVNQPMLHNSHLRLGSTGFYDYCKGAIDELRFFNRALSDGEVYEQYVYSSNRYGTPQPTVKAVSTGPVKVVGKTLTVNDEPFTVKGIGYQPIPIGRVPDRSTLDEVLADANIIDRDVKNLRLLNVNTVRLWAELPDSNSLLDALQAAGIRAILAVQVPSSGEEPGIDYANPTTRTYYRDRMTVYVNRFKSHPAVLGWAIGNENNLHYTGNIADWYTLANEMAQAAYEAEGAAYHPTILVNGHALFFGDWKYDSNDVSLGYVDMWGHNAYTRYDYHSYFSYYDMISAKPLIITEFGVDAYDTVNGNSSAEYRHTQAQWVVHEWEQIKASCVGGIVMEYCDEWWKGGSPDTQDPNGYATDVQPDIFSNEEWYGVVAVSDNGSLLDTMESREVYCALRQAFGEGELLANLDADGIVNFRDLSILASRWMAGSCHADFCCRGADLDFSDSVDMQDMAIFSGYWCEGAE